MELSKKNHVLENIFKHCKRIGDFRFHNDIVKDESNKVGFGNPFDVTKLDSKDKLPDILLENDYALIHLGGGYHKFIKGINRVYHDFEKIQTEVIWKYKKSILNQYNSSESNILSVANNQRILHDFLFEKDTEFNSVDVTKRPKTYFPHRTKTSFEYCLGDSEKINLHNIQIEIDLTIEFNGKIGVFEAKNGTPNSFAVYQIYHPFLYYHNAKNNPEIKDKITGIYGIYVVRESGENDIIKLWAYTFKKPFDITSITFVKSIAYKLIGR